MNIRTLVIQHAASPRNPPKGYGSIDKGIEVMVYRTGRERAYRAAGMDIVEAINLSQADAIAKYGEPFYSVDEDGIPI